MQPSGSPLLQAAGGLGLFLLGLSLMSEGLRSLAGNRLRRGLLRFTGNPWSGALSGAVTTALLQSSTATTVATVGFVSAGLLSFQSSLGIIFGANVGSTGLGWLVALLGIRLQLSALMLPLVLAGAGLRLLGRGRQAQLGLVLAGFGLLFSGIHGLQQSLSGQGLLLDPGRFDGGTTLGRLQLLLLGLLSTVITHSSGAGVASCLAALAAGALVLPQALALVIGMDLGSSLTALIAAMGSGLQARRTAMAHLVFNLFTAALAFLVLPAYLQLLQLGWAEHLSGGGAGGSGFLLTGFQTGFNLLGLLVMLPLAAPFAGLIRRLVPGNGDRQVDALADRPPEDPAAALDAAEPALRQTFLTLLLLLQQGLRAPQHPGGSGGGSSGDGQSGQGGPHDRIHTARSLDSLAVLQADLDRLELYLDQIHLQGQGGGLSGRLVHLLHGLDHLQRLHERCEEEPDRLRTLATCSALTAERAQLEAALQQLLQELPLQQWPPLLPLLRQSAALLQGRVEPFRRQVLAQVARGELEVEEATRRLEAMRWLNRVSDHLLRISLHLSQAAD